VTEATREAGEPPAEVAYVIAYVIALLAVRRTQLPWWQQAVAVAGLVGVGLLVVSVKIIAH
jgi:hypothetical protein